MRMNETTMVKRPSTKISQHRIGAKVGMKNIRRKSHCHPCKPPAPSNFRMPVANNGLIAFAPNMPKNRIATRLANSRLAYHVESV